MATKKNNSPLTSWCLAVGLACGDQRRLTGSGSKSEVLRDDVLYKSSYFTFFTSWQPCYLRWR